MSALPLSSTDLDQDVIDTKIAELISKDAYCPEELLCVVVDDFEPKWIRAARNLIYTQFRGALADGIANPTPANFEAVGRIAVDLLRAAWTTQAETAIQKGE